MASRTSEVADASPVEPVTLPSHMDQKYCEMAFQA